MASNPNLPRPWTTPHFCDIPWRAGDLMHHNPTYRLFVADRLEWDGPGKAAAWIVGRDPTTGRDVRFPSTDDIRVSCLAVFRARDALAPIPNPPPPPVQRSGGGGKVVP